MSSRATKRAKKSHSASADPNGTDPSSTHLDPLPAFQSLVLALSTLIFTRFEKEGAGKGTAPQHQCPACDSVVKSGVRRVPFHWRACKTVYSEKDYWNSPKRHLQIALIILYGKAPSGATNLPPREQLPSSISDVEDIMDCVKRDAEAFSDGTDDNIAQCLQHITHAYTSVLDVLSVSFQSRTIPPTFLAAANLTGVDHVMFKSQSKAVPTATPIDLNFFANHDVGKVVSNLYAAAHEGAPQPATAPPSPPSAQNLTFSDPSGSGSTGSLGPWTSANLLTDFSAPNPPSPPRASPAPPPPPSNEASRKIEWLRLHPDLDVNSNGWATDGQPSPELEMARTAQQPQL